MMALESHLDNVFSTKSNVWAFGIVMSELFTLGRVPYPNICSRETLFDRLKGGFRMEKPEFATEDIYDIMLSCWRVNPDKRPHFNQLERNISRLLEAGVAKHYISLSQPYEDENPNNLKSGQIDYIALMASPDHPAPQIPNLMNISETETPNQNDQLTGSSLESVNDSWSDDEDD